MAFWDYMKKEEIMRLDPSFDALIMAAYQKADTFNAEMLQALFPAQCKELQERYNAPGGKLEGD